MLNMLCHKWLTTSCALLCMGWLFVGCTQATGHLFSPAKYLLPSQTMVYLYFPRLPGSLPPSRTTILANGTIVTRLDEGGYYPLRASAHGMTFSLAGEPETSNVTIAGDPDHTYFVKVLIRYRGAHRYYQLFLVNDELAYGEMSPLRLMTTCPTTQGCALSP